MSDKKDRDKDGSSTPPFSSSSSSRSSRNQRAPNDIREQQWWHLTGEIDSVAADIKVEKAELKELYREKRKASSSEDKANFEEEIHKLEQSIADLKAKELRKEEERRELTQSLSGNTDRPSKRLKTTHIKMEDISDQGPLDTVDSFVNVQQKKLAGFSSDSCLLYVRQETVDLWKYIEEWINRGENISVDGPPGSGKSTEVWAWALWKAREEKKTVIWYHLSKNGATKAVIDGKVGQISTGYSAKIENIESSEGDILIVDGLTKDLSRSVKWACMNWTRLGDESRAYVVVSSVSVVVAVQEDMEAKLHTFTVNSWTYEQYERACQDADFFGAVKASLVCPGFSEEKNTMEELLLSKFYFAGGCARWMFEFDYKSWKGDFNKHFRKVGNFELLFYESAGDETGLAVNHLRGVTMLEDDKKYFFISKHAVAELAKKCDDQRKFLRKCYKFAEATQNPAFRGWIFEFDLDYQLQQALDNGTSFKQTIRVGDNREEEERRVDEYISFGTAEALIQSVQELKEEKVLWAKPELWCQKAYDFLCFHKKNDTLSMIVINATHSETHSVLLGVVNTLARRFGKAECPIKTIRFDFVVPSGAAFRIDSVEGRLVGWKNPSETPWPNSSVAQNYEDGRFIVVAEINKTKIDR